MTHISSLPPRGCVEVLAPKHLRQTIARLPSPAKELDSRVLLLLLEAERQAATKVYVARASLRPASRLFSSAPPTVTTSQQSPRPNQFPLNVDLVVGLTALVNAPGEKPRASPPRVTASWRPCLSLAKWTGFSPAASHINDYFL